MKEIKEKPILLYKLKIKVDGKEVGLKPFIYNTLGRICEALLADLKDTNEINNKEPVEIDITPNVGKKDQVKLFISSKLISINEYVQEMIWKTLVGYISTLKGIPPSFDELMKLNINITFQRI